MQRKRDYRDRNDGYYLGNMDAMHVMMPFMMPKRCDNEAVLNETIDLTAIDSYLAKKNSPDIDFKYTWFHVIAAAIAKTILLRPKMNYFICSDRYYEHKDIVVSFVVKRQLDEKSEESQAKFILNPDGGSPVDQVHDYVRGFVNFVRKSGEKETVSKQLDSLKNLPRFVWKIIAFVLGRLQYHGIYPKSLSVGDPTFSSVFITNLGSIKMNANYHHLYECGTVSFFAVIGEKAMTPFFNPDGTYQMRNSLKLSFTIDERIADGMYFAGSIRLLKHLLAHPDLLDLDAKTPITLD